MASLLYRFACRAFQKAFFIGVHFMPWREPQIIHGAGSLQKLPSHLKANGVSKVLLVTDVVLAQTEHFQNIKKYLEESGIEYAVYDQTVPNPTIDLINDATRLYKKNKCKGLVAFGGGSAIDCAKGVGIRIARPWTPISFMRGTLRVLRKIPYLVAIPTTAGTGSEATVAAVISNPKTHEKYPINDFVLIPRLAILDANITLDLPPNLTATTGMDALTHAIEAYIGNSNFDGSAEAAILAGRLIIENLQTAYNDGHYIKARENLQKASYLAGYAFTRAYVGYVHCIAHSLGGMYHTPHGLANAVILPHVLEHYGEAAEKRLGFFAKAIGAVPADFGNHEASVLFIKQIREMNRSMDIPEYLDCIRDEDIPTLAKLASKEGNPLYPVPKILNAKELETLYRIVKGTKL
jgi:alcohol dehydrogenase class IV